MSIWLLIIILGNDPLPVFGVVAELKTEAACIAAGKKLKLDPEQKENLGCMQVLVPAI